MKATKNTKERKEHNAKELHSVKPDRLGHKVYKGADKVQDKTFANIVVLSARGEQINASVNLAR